MSTILKTVIKAFTPPIIISAAKATMPSRNVDVEIGTEVSGEKGSDWYDSNFDNNDKWKKHYTLSSYYFLWTVIVDRMLRAGTTSVLEIACGSGQLACCLRDKGFQKYHGFDFSPKRLEQAQAACPQYSFSVEDAFKTDLFERFEYDSVLSTEFLEHVEGDLEVLRRIKPGTRFFGSVPNFPSISHVRHFKDEDEVKERYEQCFNELQIDSFFANDRRTKFFLIEGIIASK